MALGITTILTIMFLLGSMNSSMPKVSYAKALDWYLLVSFIFVFLSLIECMVVFILTKKYSEKKEAMKHKVIYFVFPLLFCFVFKSYFCAFSFIFAGTLTELR